jgi:hypothetical protein
MDLRKGQSMGTNEKLFIMICLNFPSLLLLFFNIYKSRSIAPIRHKVSQTIALAVLPSFNILTKF